MTYPDCYVEEKVQQNITVEECVTTHNCTLCLHDHYVNCAKEGMETCSDMAVKVCIRLCPRSPFLSDHFKTSSQLSLDMDYQGPKLSERLKFISPR